MMINKLAVLAAGVVILVTGLGISGCSEDPPPSPERTTVKVETQVVAQATVPAYISALGTVEAVDESVLSTKLMGRIESMDVGEGDRVAKGQILASIDASDVRAQVSQALSLRAEGEAGLLEAKSALANAETNLGRMHALYDEGAVTKKELDDTRTHRDMMLAKVAQAEARVSHAGSAISQAESALSYTVIKSPVDGYLVSKMMNVGDTASPGMPVFRVADISRLRVLATVKEGDSVGVTKGLACGVHVDALDIDIDGTVSEVVPVADPATRSVEVKVSVPVTEDLRPGMFARVMIPSGTRLAIALPESALVKKESVEGVYIVIDGIVAFQPIRTGDRSGGAVEVVSGLTGGESLIISDSAGLMDGMKAISE